MSKKTFVLSIFFFLSSLNIAFAAEKCSDISRGICSCGNNFSGVKRLKVEKKDKKTTSTMNAALNTACKNFESWTHKNEYVVNGYTIAEYSVKNEKVIRVESNNQNGSSGQSSNTNNTILAKGKSSGNVNSPKEGEQDEAIIKLAPVNKSGGNHGSTKKNFSLSDQNKQNISTITSNVDGSRYKTWEDHVESGEVESDDIIKSQERLEKQEGKISNTAAANYYDENSTSQNNRNQVELAIKNGELTGKDKRNARRAVNKQEDLENAKKSEYENIKIAKGMEAKTKLEAINGNYSEAINNCGDDKDCLAQAYSSKNVDAQKITDQLGEQYIYDNEASKDEDVNYFQNYQGKNLFENVSCVEMWHDLRNQPQKYASEISSILDGSITMDWGKSHKYKYETCEQRYVTDDFLTSIRDATEARSQVRLMNVCADAAKSLGNCGEFANQYRACDYINSVDDNVAKNSCQFVASLKKIISKNFNNENLLLTEIKNIEFDSNTLFSKPVSNITGVFEGSEDLKNLYDAIQEENIAKIKYIASDIKGLCQSECRQVYGEYAEIGTKVESQHGGLHGCFESVPHQFLSETVKHCFAFKEIATINFDDNELDRSDTEYASFDGKYTCQRTSAVTADYQFCKKLVTTYNASFAAEQAMGMAEGIQRSVGEAKAMGEFAEGQANGSGQVAGLNSIKSIAKTNEDIEFQKAALYTAQFATFGAFMVDWPTVNNIKKACKREDVLHPQECSNAVYFANQSGSAKDLFFPNYAVKQAFYAELIKAAGNSAVAWIKKNMYDKQQNMIDAVKDMTVVPEDSGGFVYNPTYCEQYPTSTQCRGSGNRVSVDGISGGGLNLVGGGAQDYSFSNDDLGEYNEGRGVTSNAQKADISSMLNDNVEKGGSDFNKVAGAKVSASGASGGGSPGAGGGSASLVGGGSGGEGASGAAKDGFGVTKSNAKYAAASGSAGYSGSKARQFGKDKKVDNPFSSLFGAKKNSRDVASNTENDIAPAQSSLFKKISNRYMEVKNQKRLLDSQVK